MVLRWMTIKSGVEMEGDQEWLAGLCWISDTLDDE